MKLSEVLAKFLEAKGVTHIFGVNGGANLHLIHGVVDATKISFIPCTHECNAGFAADSYARLRGLGVAMATSGPGATNLITAIATSYYDSVPVLYITGNVATLRASKPLGVRQYGFQDFPICDAVRDCTKRSRRLDGANVLHVVDILQELCDAAKHGRPGPVLLDIPDDLQRADIPYPER